MGNTPSSIAVTLTELTIESRFLAAARKIAQKQTPTGTFHP